jgi:prefoldin subunit 5
MLQCTFILAFLCHICLADIDYVAQLNHRVEQLERQVTQLQSVFNRTISTLQSEIANLNIAIENVSNNTGKEL